MTNDNKISFQEKINRIYEDKKLVTADYGKSGVVLFDGSNTFFKKPSNFISFLNENYKGWTFAGESAHFAVPRKHSQAQIFEAEELLEWYKESEASNIGLFFSPHQCSLNVLRYSEINNLEDEGITDQDLSWHNVKQKKADARDARALYRYIMNHRNFCDGFKTPPKTFTVSTYTKHVRETKKRMNNALDDMKTHKYGCFDEIILSDQNLKELAYNSSSGITKKQIEENINQKTFFKDEVSRFFYPNLNEIASRCDSDTQEAFGMEFKTEKAKDENGKNVKIQTNELKKLKSPQFFAVVMPFMGERTKGDSDYVSGDITLRQYGKGKTGLWSWCKAKKDLFSFSPHHYKSGAPASNLKHHGKRNYVIDQARKLFGVEFKKLDPKKPNNKSLTLFKTKAEIFNEGHGEIWQTLNSKYVKCTQKLFEVIKDFLIEKHPDLQR